MRARHMVVTARHTGMRPPTITEMTYALCECAGACKSSMVLNQYHETDQVLTGLAVIVNGHIAIHFDKDTGVILLDILAHEEHHDLIRGMEAALNSINGYRITMNVASRTL